MSKKSSGSASPSRRTTFLSVPAWPLRRKVALALAIPMILAAVFGALRVSDAVRDQRDYASTQDQLTVLHPYVDYFDAVEEAAVVAVSTRPGNAKRDEALAKLRAAAEELSTAREATDLPPEHVSSLDRTLGATSALLEDDGFSDLQAVVGQLRILYAGVQEYTELVISDQLVPEPTLPQITFAVGGRLAFTVQQIQIDRFSGSLRNPYDVYGDLGMEQAAIDQLLRIRGAEDVLLALSGANETRREQVTAGKVDLPYEETFALYDQLNDSVLDEAEKTLATWSADAEKDAMISAGVTAGALLLATLLALLVSRMLVRPVQRVRDGALEVAHELLPESVARIRAGEDPGEIEPIDVHTDEEIGQLARAVDDMHRTAVRLAAGEARIKSQVGEMFVTLSRRNTSLVNQQLSLIESLERDEDDPERLQSLFRLDHLAARMRRTAESLVILSDAPVRGREAAPMAVSDVIQAAAGGVEQYERIQIMGFPTEQVVGSATSDLVHLLTELIDNALSFSAPSTGVEVTTTTSSAETVIRVSDQGLGMTDQQIDALNEMLRSGGEVTPDTARRMGLFVVSRLAHRHGISVRLSTNSRGGVIASVSLPPELLASAPASLVPQQPVAAAPAQPAFGAAAPVPAEAPAPVEEEVDPIVAAINAVTGLPQRRPGATRSDRVETVTPATAGGLFGRPADEPTAPSVPAAPTSAPSLAPVPSVSAETAEPAGGNEPSYRVPLIPRRTLDDQVQGSLEPEVQRPAAPPTTWSGDAAPAPTVSAPSSFAATVSSDQVRRPDPLNDPYSPQDHVGGDQREESPIFASLQSSWLGRGGGWGPSTADEGWRAAEAATEQAVEERSTSGLPQRRPGNRLVPGTAGPRAVPEPSIPSRDPEAVRARLAAHAAGVNRGRSASTQTSTNHEEVGPA